MKVIEEGVETTIGERKILQVGRNLLFRSRAIGRVIWKIRPVELKIGVGWWHVIERVSACGVRNSGSATERRPG